MKSLVKTKSSNDNSSIFFEKEDDHRQYVNVFLKYQATQRSDSASSNISRIEVDEQSSKYYRDVMKSDDSVFSSIKSKTAVSIEQREAQLATLDHLMDVKELTKVVSFSLSYLSVADLKRLQVMRTANLRYATNLRTPRRGHHMAYLNCTLLRYTGVA